VSDTYDVNLVKKCFEDRGYNVEVKSFADVDFRKESYRGKLVVYQSSEDAGLTYKDFIEDILLGIDLQGGILLPAFPYFRAHHNKGFMEILRDLSDEPALQTIAARRFGALEEFLQRPISYPKVFKVGANSGSRDVHLVRSEAEARRLLARASWTATAIEAAKEWAKRRIRSGYVPRSLHRRKFIAQDFVPGLGGDFKVLVFGPKYFVLYRRNRKNDFRASGSGLFSFPEEPPVPLLNFAKLCFDHFAVPFISLDIGQDGSRCHLLEFQFTSFGPYTLEKSEWHFVHGNAGWRRVDSQTTVEREFADSVVAFVSGPSPGIRERAQPLQNETAAPRS
jgi:hypothetical protein